MPSCFLLSRYAWSYKTGLSSPKERNGREKRKPKSELWGVTTHLWSGRKSWQWSILWLKYYGWNLSFPLTRSVPPLPLHTRRTKRSWGRATLEHVPVHALVRARGIHSDWPDLGSSYANHLETSFPQWGSVRTRKETCHYTCFSFFLIWLSVQTGTSSRPRTFFF